MGRLFYSLLVVIILEVAAAFTHAEEVSLGA
jgi:hypothetical protein